MYWAQITNCKLSLQWMKERQNLAQFEGSKIADIAKLRTREISQVIA